MSCINVMSLGKAYKQYPSQWSRLVEWFAVRNKPKHILHWVLQDVSFTVQAGESVGIIGANGAGKSTLLKLIAGTIQPTTGSVISSGRVAALLELGMGFHPDFTGRQNVFMAGQLHGYSQRVVLSLMPEIEAFADIGEYLDQPVRVYSSGMQVRLAFAIATAVRPEILIVDEALAVGDAAFQRKCHRRIESFVEKGTALLFVSHDIEGVKKICSKALYLDRGRVINFGDAKVVCDEYENMLFAGVRNPHLIGSFQKSNIHDSQAPIEGSMQIDLSLMSTSEVSYGNGDAHIEEVWIEDGHGNSANVLISGEMFSICYTVNLNKDAKHPVFAMLIKTLEGISLYGTDSISLGKLIPKYVEGQKYLVRFSMRCNLADGVYFLNCGIRSDVDRGLFYHRRVDAIMFKVRKVYDLGQAGLVNLNASLTIDCA